ncbi:MAG: NYN domain-containing protein, partial [Rhodobacterales bacterium]|nr:NYN domain-containing protein [Rhodobacterales bacterium]
MYAQQRYIARGGSCFARASTPLGPLHRHQGKPQRRARNARTETSLEAHIAVLIDFENIAAGTDKEGLGRFDIKAVMERFKDKGRILIARSYADWGRFSRFKQGLLAENVTMMELTSHGMQDKNRADIALVVDALELAFTRDYIDTYVIVSGDSDFTPMVLKMRELNKRVIGCGTRRSTSRLLIGACDEFLFYDSIVKSQGKRRPNNDRRSSAASPKLSEAFDLLVKALDGLQLENSDAPRAGAVKSAIKRRTPDFSENDLGFNSFARFLEKAADRGIVVLNRDRKGGGYRVETPDAASDDDLLEVSGSSEPKVSKWVDPYIPAGAEVYVKALDEKGLHPLSTPSRKLVLEALDGVVKERNQRRRKTTINFVGEDIKRKLRRTMPEVSVGLIRGVLEALRQSGQLLHRDGNPIRTPSASFTLSKNAEELNSALLNNYLANLSDAGCDMSNTAVIAELLLGNAEQTRAVEESLAWLVTAPQGVGDAQDLNEVDLDALLVIDDVLTVTEVSTEAAPVVEETSAASEAPVAEKPKRKRKTKAQREAEEAAKATVEPIDL